MTISCNKDNEASIPPYAILIDVNVDTLHLSQRLLMVERQSFFNKKYYRITPNVYYRNNPSILSKNNVKTYRIHKSKLLFFEDITTANYLLEKTSGYSNAQIMSTRKPIIVREYPSIHKKKLLIIPKNKSAIIISPIVDADTKYLDNTFADADVNNTIFNNTIINGKWIRIQYNLKHGEYIRGWVLIDEAMLFMNPTLPESMLAFHRTAMQSKIWKEKEKDNINNTQDIFGSKENTLQVSFNKNNGNLQIDTVNLTQNGSNYIISHGQLWPLSPEKIFDPINDITFQPLPNEKQIIVSIPYSEPVIYIPYDEMKTNAPSIAKKNIISIYEILLSGLSTNKTFIEWKSNLYGVMYMSQNITTDASFKINIDWNTTEEIATIYFPEGVKTLRGILEFSNVISDYTNPETDGVIKFTIINTNQILFLSYKMIDSNTISLQFFPESEIRYDDDNNAHITTSPVLPKMVFKKKR